MGRPLDPKVVPYEHADGSLTYRVRVRVNGRQTTETFTSPAAAAVFVARVKDPTIGPKRAVALRWADLITEAAAELPLLVRRAHARIVGPGQVLDRPLDRRPRLRSRHPVGAAVRGACRAHGGAALLGPRERSRLMFWFKVDDKLHDHREARAAQKAAMGVWVLAGSWAADNLTDMFVTASVLSRWGTKADARRLVDVGLWVVDEKDGEDGWRFHAWSDFQPTRAAKLAERAAKAEAGRKGGRASGAGRCEAGTKQDASALVKPPSRPVPTRPVFVVTESGQSRSLTRVDADGLTRIAQLTKGDEQHARATAELILSKTSATVVNPTAYVLAAIRDQPDAYRYRRGNPRRGQDCPDHPGEWADACRLHAADGKAAR